MRFQVFSQEPREAESIRTLYFVRHGMPEFPGNERMCIGSTDLPLSPSGMIQAEAAARFLTGKKYSAVFCSRLLRSVQTAAAFGGGTVIDGLEELCAGDWDGLTFDEIHAGWPELFGAGEKETPITPPGAESNEAGASRFKKAVMNALNETEGDILFSTHATVLQLFLCDIDGLPYCLSRKYLIPYGSVTQILYDETKRNFKILSIGNMPDGSDGSI